MNISQIGDTIEYLELKTPQDIVITHILNIVQSDDFWLIHTRKGIYKFTKKANLSSKLDNKGKAPMSIFKFAV